MRLTINKKEISDHLPKKLISWKKNKVIKFREKDKIVKNNVKTTYIRRLLELNL